MNNVLKLRAFILIIVTIIAHPSLAQTVLNTPNTESILYLGDGENQPLIIGLGGSEGGNAWATDRWAVLRNQFIDKGYAFLAVGYFGAEGTPPVLDGIALEDIHRAITTAASNPRVDQDRIAMVGGSRGADLALLLGSY